MRKIFFLVTFSLFFANFCFAEDIKPTSAIASAVVYPDSALVNRTASLKLENGQYNIYFSDIVPEIDDNSLRVSGKGSAQVKIFGAQLKKEFLEKPYSERITKLQDEIQQLKDQIQSVDDEKGVLSNEEEFLKSIKLFSGEQIPKDLVTKMPQLTDLDNTIKFIDDKLTANYKKQLALDKQKREIQKKLDSLQREFNQLASRRGSDLEKHSIVVELEVEKTGTLDLVVSYLVRNVSWNMVYDARASIKEKNVELISYGVIKQRTGEDWVDVDISLSTAKPSIGGRMPYIAPWFLKPYEPIVLQKKSRMLYKSAADDIGEQFQAMAPAVELAEGKVEDVSFSFADAQQKGTAMVYSLSRKATIKSDGTEHKLPISTQILKTDFEYSVCPKISPFVYLGSRVTNSDDLQLLTGKINVFLEGDYTGASSIDNIGPGEKFDLYLGVDEGLKIERKEIEKKVDDTLFGGISSSTKKTFFKYKIKLENYKSDKIKINLFEPMPVSSDDKIVVKIGKVSLDPVQKDWEDRKGIWKWQLELQQKEKQEIYFDYTIEHPRNIQVQGL